MACSSAPGPTAGPNEPIGRTSQAIYGGVLDDDAQANSAVVALTVTTTPGQFVLCTATLIAPNVVLTAHHCVGSNLAATVTCDSAGQSTSGTQIGADVNPTAIHVFAGAEPDLSFGTPDANGYAIFDTESTALCNSDIAVVLLDRALPGITPLAVRLSSATKAGEAVRAVGFGQNDQGAAIGTRFRKDGVPVLAVGAEISPSGTPLAASEIEVAAATCEGDSGGPAISEETGAVVGVVSRAAACAAPVGHVYTATSGFAKLITGALAAAGEVPLEEVITVDGSAPPATPPGSPTATPGGSKPPATSAADAGPASETSPRPTDVAPGATTSQCAARIARSPAGGARFGAAFFLLGIAAAARRRSRARR